MLERDHGSLLGGMANTKWFIKKPELVIFHFQVEMQWNKEKKNLPNTPITRKPDPLQIPTNHTQLQWSTFPKNPAGKSQQFSAYEKKDIDGDSEPSLPAKDKRHLRMALGDSTMAFRDKGQRLAEQILP